MSKDLLQDVASRATRYLDDVRQRRVSPSPDALREMQRFAVELQDDSIDAAKVLAELDTLGSPATVACTGGRYFGFVTGGALPAPLAANMLAAAWDQNSGLEVQSPIAAHLERVCRDWMIALLGLPAQTEIGFVTGATMANFTGLAAARHSVLRAQGWDVEAQGLFGAPPLTVVVGDEVHVSLMKGLGMLGLGRERVVRVPVDGQGRLIAARLPAIDGPSIVCLQAGNVNTGAFDPIGEVAARLHGTGAWIHVDGAFGLWAAASSQKRALISGIDLADSLATDAHKWLNVPYDSGLVFVRDARALYAAMSANAAYFPEGQTRDPQRFVPEGSRRARAIEVWAALRSLGRRGLAEMIERNCRHAERFANELRKAGYQVLNDVVLNQVLVSFGAPE
ncbi:MAG TPA: pyridoxal-dependent decarboxylase, partial [Steroidobacteraceae bacterium]|nr:pyridoxal-dependent decarboxylase [Steroidobacteraceae bacterium]